MQMHLLITAILLTEVIKIVTKMLIGSLILLFSISAAESYCPLISFSSSHVRGFNGASVRVERSFQHSMRTINAVASSCDVTVIVTSSFRRINSLLSGAIVPPARHSNHLVGHAIDFNLQTTSGWCNSRCLRGRTNEHANCFTNGVKAGNLRWGGDFSKSDPLHIDDNLYWTNEGKWMKLFSRLQDHCQ